MRKVNLLLHCGAHAADREQVDQVITPDNTDTWYPIPHTTLIEQVEGQMKEHGLTVINQQHSLMNDDARYFGLMQVMGANDAEDSDHCFVVGLRNSHDKSFNAGLVVGNSVFVCDNLSFSGEIQVGRKHTLKILQDLPRLISQAFGKLVESRIAQEHRFNVYKETGVSDDTVRKLLIDAVKCDALKPTKIMKLWDEWKEPRHKEFEPRTAWSLHNCYTEISKGLNPVTLASRTQRISPLLDTICGLEVGKVIVDDIEDAEFTIKGQNMLA